MTTLVRPFLPVIIRVGLQRWNAAETASSGFTLPQTFWFILRTSGDFQKGDGCNFHALPLPLASQTDSPHLKFTPLVELMLFRAESGIYACVIITSSSLHQFRLS